MGERARRAYDLIFLERMLVSAKVANGTIWRWVFDYTAAAHTYYHSVRALGHTHFKYRQEGSVITMDDLRKENGVSLPTEPDERLDL